MGGYGFCLLLPATFQSRWEDHGLYMFSQSYEKISRGHTAFGERKQASSYR